MSRSRDLANLANNASGLETLTVSDITDLTATVTELNYLDGVTGTGISNNNILKANANIVDNDFLRVDGTSIEGRSASEVVTDLDIASGLNVVQSGNIGTGDSIVIGSDSDGSNTVLTSAYDAYWIICNNLQIATGTDLNLRFFYGGSQLTSSSYNFVCWGKADDSVTFMSEGSTDTTHPKIDAGEDISGTENKPNQLQIWLNNPFTSLKHQIQFRFQFHTNDDHSGLVQGLVGTGGHATTTAATGVLTAIRLFPGSGNMSAGTFTVYGLKKS